eukprot:g6523.t1
MMIFLSLLFPLSVVNATNLAIKEDAFLQILQITNQLTTAHASLAEKHVQGNDEANEKLFHAHAMHQVYRHAGDFLLEHKKDFLDLDITPEENFDPTRVSYELAKFANEYRSAHHKMANTHNLALKKNNSTSTLHFHKTHPTFLANDTSTYESILSVFLEEKSDGATLRRTASGKVWNFVKAKLNFLKEVLVSIGRLFVMAGQKLLYDLQFGAGAGVTLTGGVIPGVVPSLQFCWDGTKTFQLMGETSDETTKDSSGKPLDETNLDTLKDRVFKWIERKQRILKSKLNPERSSLGEPEAEVDDTTEDMVSESVETCECKSSVVRSEIERDKLEDKLKEIIKEQVKRNKKHEDEVCFPRDPKSCIEKRVEGECNEVHCKWQDEECILLNPQNNSDCDIEKCEENPGCEIISKSTLEEQKTRLNTDITSKKERKCKFYQVLAKTKCFLNDLKRLFLNCLQRENRSDFELGWCVDLELYIGVSTPVNPIVSVGFNAALMQCIATEYSELKKLSRQLVDWTPLKYLDPYCKFHQWMKKMVAKFKIRDETDVLAEAVAEAEVFLSETEEGGADSESEELKQATCNLEYAQKEFERIRPQTTSASVEGFIEPKAQKNKLIRNEKSKITISTASKASESLKDLEIIKNEIKVRQEEFDQCWATLGFGFTFFNPGGGGIGWPLGLELQISKCDQEMKTIFKSIIGKLKNWAADSNAEFASSETDENLKSKEEEILKTSLTEEKLDVDEEDCTSNGGRWLVIGLDLRSIWKYISIGTFWKTEVEATVAATGLLEAYYKKSKENCQGDWIDIWRHKKMQTGKAFALASLAAVQKFTFSRKASTTVVEAKKFKQFKEEDSAELSVELVPTVGIGVTLRVGPVIEIAKLVECTRNSIRNAQLTISVKKEKENDNSNKPECTLPGICLCEHIDDECPTGCEEKDLSGFYSGYDQHKVCIRSNANTKAACMEGCEVSDADTDDKKNINVAISTFKSLEAEADGGQGATGSASIDTTGKVTSISVVDPGEFYNEPPFILITGGGGLGAKAVARIEQGEIVGIDVTDPGTGYINPPQIIFTKENPCQLFSWTVYIPFGQAAARGLGTCSKGEGSGNTKFRDSPYCAHFENQVSGAEYCRNIDDICLLGSASSDEDNSGDSFTGECRPSCKEKCREGGDCNPNVDTGLYAFKTKQTRYYLCCDQTDRKLERTNQFGTNYEIPKERIGEDTPKCMNLHHRFTEDEAGKGLAKAGKSAATAAGKGIKSAADATGKGIKEGATIKMDACDLLTETQCRSSCNRDTERPCAWRSINEPEMEDTSISVDADSYKICAARVDTLDSSQSFDRWERIKFRLEKLNQAKDMKDMKEKCEVQTKKKKCRLYEKTRECIPEAVYEELKRQHGSSISKEDERLLKIASNYLLSGSKKDWKDLCKEEEEEDEKGESGSEKEESDDEDEKSGDEATVEGEFYKHLKAVISTICENRPEKKDIGKLFTMNFSSLINLFDEGYCTQSKDECSSYSPCKESLPEFKGRPEELGEEHKFRSRWCSKP